MQFTAGDTGFDLTVFLALLVWFTASDDTRFDLTVFLALSWCGLLLVMSDLT